MFRVLSTLFQFSDGVVGNQSTKVRRIIINLLTWLSLEAFLTCFALTSKFRYGGWNCLSPPKNRYILSLLMLIQSSHLNFETLGLKWSSCFLLLLVNLEVVALGSAVS